MQPILNAGPRAEAVKDVTTATFMADVVDASYDQPVVVDFWAPWCGPCRTLGPVLEKTIRETKGAVRMVKVNIDENPEIAQQMRIQSIPAVYAFKDGRPIDGFVGALPESQVKQFIKRLAGAGQAQSPVAEALAQAKAALAEGDLGTAGTFYRHILQHEPDNVEAAAGLARVMLADGKPDKAEQLIAKLPPDKAGHADIQAVKTAIELAAQAASSGDARALERRLAADANDHQARFDLAMQKFGRGDREAAVDLLLDIVKRDRSWNDDGARKQLVKFFEAFGPTDPLTVSARRRLSALLFA